MGIKSRPRVKRLPEKLRAVRENAGLSQNDILRELGYADSYDRTTISHYESGEREPPLPVLLAYARFAGVPMEALVDDELEL